MTDPQLQRYARQIALPGFGVESQERLSHARVLLIGAGGLGSPAAFYLAAAGVGHITIADGDTLDLSNLQRQILHTTADIGNPKAYSAASHLRALNPEIEITPLPRRINRLEMRALVSHFDFIIEATDSLDTKFITDQACCEARKPYSHGAIRGYEGHTMTVLPGTARLLDLFPDGAESVETIPPTGPLGVVAGIIGTIQAAEALKYITGIGTLLTNRLLRVDMLTLDFTTVNLPTPLP